MTGDERLDLEPAHLILARSLLDKLERQFGLGREGRTVVAIAGESGSGKSISATALAAVLAARGRSAVVLHQDDYFIRPPRANHAHRIGDLSGVGPHEVRLELLASHIAGFRAGRDVPDAPRADHHTDSFVTRRLDLATASVLIVEGTYVLTLEDSDVRIFLEATHEETAERRRQRNRDVDAPIIDRILDIEHALIALQARRADILVDRHFGIRA